MEAQNYEGREVLQRCGASELVVSSIETDKIGQAADGLKTVDAVVTDVQMLQELQLLDAFHMHEVVERHTEVSQCC